MASPVNITTCTYIASDTPTTAYGGNSSIVVGTAHEAKSNHNIVRGLLRQSIAGQYGSPPAAVRLGLYLYDNAYLYSSPQTVHIYPVRRMTWSETYTSWQKYGSGGSAYWTTYGCDDTTNDRASTPTTSFAVSTKDIYYEPDVTDIYEAFFNGDFGASYDGVNVRLNFDDESDHGEGNNNYAVFNSDDSGTNKPYVEWDEAGGGTKRVWGTVIGCRPLKWWPGFGVGWKLRGDLLVPGVPA